MALLTSARLGVTILERLRLVSLMLHLFIIELDIVVGGCFLKG